MSGLSARQRLVLRALDDYITAHGYAPSMRELVDMGTASSTSVVGYTLTLLEASGHIQRTPGIARGIRILNRYEG